MRIGLAPDATPATFAMYELLTGRSADASAIHREWRAGRLTTTDLSENLLWAWPLMRNVGSTTDALAMLEAVGYLTDRADLILPDQVDVYQGRAVGERLGLSWTPDAATAVGYAETAVRWWGKRGERRDPIVCVGTVRREDVLLWSWLARELVVRPERVQRVTGVTPADVADRKAPAWAVLSADGLRRVDDVWTGRVRSGRMLTRLLRAVASA